MLHSPIKGKGLYRRWTLLRVWVVLRQSSSLARLLSHLMHVPWYITNKLHPKKVRHMRAEHGQYAHSAQVHADTPVCQALDNEEEGAMPRDTTQRVGGVKAEQIHSKVILNNQVPLQGGLNPTGVAHQVLSTMDKEGHFVAVLTDGACNNQVPQQVGLNPKVVAH